MKKKITKRKTSVKSSDAQHEMIDAKTEHLLDAPTALSRPQTLSGARAVAIGITVLAALAMYLGGKGYIVAAMVNGKPVFRWDVEREMVARFGNQTLENIISERLIADAAANKGVSVSRNETDAKISDVMKSLGPNVKLDDLLKYQGMTKADFEKQIRLQLTVEKILGKDIAVTDKEIDEFISKNKETMTATDEAALRGEARDALQSQKVNEKIQPWFAELKNKASVVRLMK